MVLDTGALAALGDAGAGTAKPPAQAVGRTLSAVGVGHNALIALFSPARLGTVLVALA